MRALAVFAYGTLVTGGLDAAVDALIRRCGSKRREASVRGRLYDLGDFPGLVPSPRRTERVHGEILYLRDAPRCLAALDTYEDCDPARPERGLYRRQWSRLRLADGSATHAWVYWYNGSLAAAPRIAHGDWRTWCGAAGVQRKSWTMRGR